MKKLKNKSKISKNIKKHKNHKNIKIKKTTFSKFHKKSNFHDFGVSPRAHALPSPLLIGLIRAHALPSYKGRRHVALATINSCVAARIPIDVDTSLGIKH